MRAEPRLGISVDNVYRSQASGSAEHVKKRAFTDVRAASFE